MHQLIEDKGFSDGGCDRVRLRLQCLAFAARLRRSSALPGPWSIVDNKNRKCKSAALFSLHARFTEGRQRKVTSRLRKLVFSEWHRGCLQHVARAYSLHLHPVHESLCISTKQTLNSLTKSFIGHAVDLDKKLNQHPPTRHTLDNAMMRLSVVPGARPGREQPPRNTTSTPRNRSGQVGKGR